ncbi:C2 domain containing protein [Parasponia andersonii]|uniref:C2 domain containing protein n=1 Tax=Parasponia andersonii TaxID=3476 RepID=A0A2P5ANS5_PARAD|nr:C2 domain containing protein [Parasponia andersonii]
MSILNPFQLLELNVISAQDLSPASRSMRTYAVAWVHPDRKLSTRVDTQGHNNPTWNDKFVFRVDEDFLRTDTSAIMIEIYALHWFKDIHVGTVRILVGNLIPTPPTRTPPSSFHNHHRHHQHYHHPQLGMRFVALQVRRASGRPQGILNIGVALLHSSMRSMPLYSQLSTSAVGYRELMGEEDPIHRDSNNNGGNVQTSTIHMGLLSELRRTKSDVSSMIGSENRANEFREKGKTGKMSNSMLNGSEAGSKLRRKGRSKKGGSSSLLSSAGGTTGNKGRMGKPGSVINGSEVSVDPPKKGKNGKASSLINGFSEVLVVDPPKKGKSGKKGSLINVNASPRIKPSPRFNLVDRGGPRNVKSPFHHAKFQAPYEYGTPRKSTLMGHGGGAYLTESELGPSPSEVAAAIAKQPIDQEAESSIVGRWSVDESVEGLRSKLERWRTELPPVYDRGEFSSFPPSESRHNRRHSDGDSGLFSCFSNICGVECSIVCGSGGGSGSKKKGSGRLIRSPSAEHANYK